MRRRILLAIVGVVAAALAFTGTGTYFLLYRQAAGTTEANLRDEARSMVRVVGDSRQASTSVEARRRATRSLRLEGIAVRYTSPDGQTVGPLPDGVTDEDIDQAALELGATVSGHHDRLAWAAAGLPRTNGATLSVVVTAPVQPASAPVGWYLLSAAVGLALAAAVAWAVSGGLTKPLREARVATARIAGGDLATTLDEPPPNRHDEVADLTRSINAMAAALERSRGAERQFLLSVSHDLRTPLTSIRGWADAVVDGKATDPAAAARIIGGEAQRLDRLVSDLLDLARLDSAAYTFNRQALPVGEVVGDAAEAFRPQAEADGIELVLVDSSAGAAAEVDPDRLTQAVANLVENGLRYAAGRLTVLTRTVEGRVLIEVADDGPGIAVYDLERVFDRRFVSDQRPVRRSQPPSGLGLAIVHDLVAAMGGQVEARSTTTATGTGTGTGATLVIDLPRATG